MAFHETLWKFIKDNKAYIILCLVALVVLVVIVSGVNNNRSMLDTMAEEHRLAFENQNRNLEEVRTIHENEILELTKINQHQEEELRRLDSEYRERLEGLEARVRTRRTRFVTETSGNSTEMARRVAERYNWHTSTPPSPTP